MQFALSTNWNVHRHADGAALVDEIARLGFDGIELGYRLNWGHVEGVKQALAGGAVTCCSVHAYCPIPLGAPGGHPELFLMGDRDEDGRRLAVLNLLETLRFAAGMGATAVVAHAARVRMGRAPGRLAEWYGLGRTTGWRYRLLRWRMVRGRQRRVGRTLDALRRSLDELLPLFEQAGIRLCLENLPSWDAVPNEAEIEELVRAYATPALACWHDLGHGQVRANLGWIDHREEAQRLLPITAGVHIHDVLPPDRDHLAPGDGQLRFSDFSFYGRPGILRVFEPGPAVTAEGLTRGLRQIRQEWDMTAPGTTGKEA